MAITFEGMLQLYFEMLLNLVLDMHGMAVWGQAQMCVYSPKLVADSS